MDNTEKPPTVLSLCSGYGGLEIGLKRVFGEISILAHVEIEAYAIARMVNKMETKQMAPAPIWTDLKTFKAGLFRGIVDILTGGYPCQPFSFAGKRRGSEDVRHLWPFVRETIRACRPGWVFLENVEGHIDKGLPEVLADLEKMGYKSEVGIFSAVEVGAPHQRKRAFVLAHDQHAGPLDLRAENNGQVAKRGTLTDRQPAKKLCAFSPESRWPARPGEKQYKWERQRTVPHILHNPKGTKSGLGGAAHGPPDRTDRIRLLGNGVVPQTAERAFRTLYGKL